MSSISKQFIMWWKALVFLAFMQTMKGVNTTLLETYDTHGKCVTKDMGSAIYISPFSTQDAKHDYSAGAVRDTSWENSDTVYTNVLTLMNTSSLSVYKSEKVVIFAGHGSVTRREINTTNPYGWSHITMQVKDKNLTILENDVVVAVIEDAVPLNISVTSPNETLWKIHESMETDSITEEKLSSLTIPAISNIKCLMINVYACEDCFLNILTSAGKNDVIQVTASTTSTSNMKDWYLYKVPIEPGVENKIKFYPKKKDNQKSENWGIDIGDYPDVINKTKVPIEFSGASAADHDLTTVHVIVGMVTLTFILIAIGFSGLILSKYKKKSHTQTNSSTLSLKNPNENNHTEGKDPLLSEVITENKSS